MRTFLLIICLALGGAVNAQSMKPLTPEEKRVIVEKGTEAPFSGQYYNHREAGVYHCRQCGAPLYRSADKFDAGCGWPSFDEELPGAVRRTPDADGRRTEITCARCGAHLGHVFTGERFTPKNTRHCVNSVSLHFEPAAGAEEAGQKSGSDAGAERNAEKSGPEVGSAPGRKAETADGAPKAGGKAGPCAGAKENGGMSGSDAGDEKTAEKNRSAVGNIAVSGGETAARSRGAQPEAAGPQALPTSGAAAPAKEQTETAIFAGGCFWGVEYMLSKVPGVLSVVSGYTGGTTETPTYEQVCSHRTGHAEAVRVVFDPAKVSYEKLTRLFLEIHDPTQAGGQGPDLGDQYRSEIFYTSPAQQQTAEKLLARLRDKGYDVVTELTPAGRFWPAEEYHQRYYERKGTLPYCHTYTRRF